jgi:purine-nucleoside phosphorylase
MNKSLEEKILETKAYLSSLGLNRLDIVIVAGTGLGGLEEILETKKEISYADIPHFPKSNVIGHNSKLVFGNYKGTSIGILSGRFHYYEGYEMEEITYYIHIVKALEARELIITNASGGVNPTLTQGEIVVVKDHINMFPQNPLRGIRSGHLGPMFPDMVHAYPSGLRQKFLSIANGIKEVVYIGWQGPNLETPSEYKMARILGADIVGMSTVPEVIVAKYRSLPVLVISIVSNVFDFDNPMESDIDDIIQTMKASGENLKELLIRYLQPDLGLFYDL